MGILTRDEIIKRVKSGEIGIEPFKEEWVDAVSIDFHLGNTFRKFKEQIGIYQVDEKANYEEIFGELEEYNDFILLKPRDTVLGITAEKLTLPKNICAFIEGRSSIGRLGIAVHITAGLIHPGVAGNQVLEISNMGPITMALHPGVAICQIIFSETVGEAAHTGRYAKQNTP